MNKHMLDLVSNTDAKFLPPFQHVLTISLPLDSCVRTTPAFIIPTAVGKKPQLPSHTHKLIATICLSHKCRCENRQSRLIVKTNHSIWVWKVGFHRTKMFFVLGHVHSWPKLNIYICRSDELSRRPLFWMMCMRSENGYRHIPGTADGVNNRLTEKQKERTLKRFGLCWDQLLQWKWFDKCLLKWSECTDTGCFNFTIRITVETEMQKHWLN